MLKMQHIHLSYGDNVALVGMDFHLKAGEVHALIGEHRSGKTSLMRVLAGEIKPNNGNIILHDHQVDFNNPTDAISAGIGIVHQDLKIITSLNSIENIFGSLLPKAWFKLTSHDRYIKEAYRLLEQMGINDIDLSVPTGLLSQTQQQAIEFARIMALDPDIIILDEISHRKNTAEMDRIMSITKRYREDGKGIIYVTPDINEVFEIADRVTVMSDGHRKSTNQVKDLDRLRLVRMAYNLAIDQTDEALPIAMRQLNEKVIRDLPFGVFIFDASERLIMASEAGGRLCATPVADLIERTIDQIIRTNIIDKGDEILSAIHKREKNIWEGIHFGSSEFTRVQTSNIQDDELQVVGRVLLVQDATLEENVTEYLAHAEKMQSTAELAAGVAHEINNPLGTIRNYVELLKLNNENQLSGNRLERITKEIDKITDIISSLLSFSKIRQENRLDVDTVELIREVTTLLGHRFREKHLRLSVSLPDNPVIISADENRIKQILVNILINSIEATLDGDQIDISMEKASTYLEQSIEDIRETSSDRHTEINMATEMICIHVKDNGSGIPDEVLDRVFQPFFSTKASRTNTGLGLSISKHIIEAHGGEIRIKSITGEHTKVTICLPLKH